MQPPPSVVAKMDNEMKGVYKIVNLESGKYYVGSSNDLHKRWTQHLSCLRRGKHKNRHLQNAWNKYAEDVFAFVVVVETETQEEAHEIEQKWLDEKELKYNIADSVQVYAYWKGKNHSDKTKAKLMEGSGKNKLMPEQVLEIRGRYKRPPTHKELAQEYGVSATTISRIIRRETWKYL